MPIYLNRSCLFICLFALISCKRIEKEQPLIDPSWHKLTLSNGWTIYAPPGFISKSEQGIDSNPGVIYSKKDSIFLQYDSGPFESNNNSHCDLKSFFEAAQASIDTGFYKTFYKVPIIHKAEIDTIDDRIAIILRPSKTGEGTVGIEISGCKQLPWIGITGKNLKGEKDKLVVEIYKTLKKASK
jgi:hypothetical protein